MSTLRSPKPNDSAGGSEGSEPAKPAGGLTLECAFCGESAEGNFSIHRDGFGVGPEVELCDNCAAYPAPTCEEIWEVIAEPSDDPGAYLQKEQP